jgi:hypothetical protein
MSRVLKWLTSTQEDAILNLGLDTCYPQNDFSMVCCSPYTKASGLCR